MSRCPDHIRPYATHFTGDTSFAGYECDEFAPCFEVICTCGCNSFRIYTSAVPTVVAECSRCHTRVVVYDVRQYPAATPSRGTELPETKIRLGTDDCFRVFAVYEYGERDEDQEDDPNDISWFDLFAMPPGKAPVRVMTDETA